jgi:hypothetical protein
MYSTYTFHQELHPKFQAFPTYPIILPFKHTDQEVIDFYARSAATPIEGVPKFDTKGVLDGERRIQFFKPLPTSSEGRNFEIRSKVLGVYDKGKPGTVVETEQCLVDKDSGEVYSRAVGSGFYVGQGGWGGPKGEFQFAARALIVVEVCIIDTAQAPRLSITHPLPVALPTPHR